MRAIRFIKKMILLPIIVLLLGAPESSGASIRDPFKMIDVQNLNLALPDFGIKGIAFLKNTARDGFTISVSSLRSFFVRPSTNMVTTLQDKIVELERQIRASKEESRQLRALLNSQRNQSRRSRSDDVRRSAEVERVLGDQMVNLSKRIEELSQSKGEMEQLLKREKEYVNQLEKMLKDEKDSKVTLFEKHAEELEQMRKQALLKSEEQIKKVEKDIVAKMELEIQRIQKEYDALLAKERAKSKELEKERDEFRDVAENERVKMRKLVKVLAEREKREIAMSSHMASETSNVSGPSIISSGASGMNNANTKRKLQNFPNPFGNPKK